MNEASRDSPSPFAKDGPKTTSAVGAISASSISSSVDALATTFTTRPNSAASAARIPGSSSTTASADVIVSIRLSPGCPCTGPFLVSTSWDPPLRRSVRPAAI